MDREELERRRKQFDELETIFATALSEIVFSDVITGKAERNEENARLRKDSQMQLLCLTSAHCTGLLVSIASELRFMNDKESIWESGNATKN